MTIDLVVPYVDNNDIVWQQTYIQYFLKKDYKQIAALRSRRYEDIGLINYQLKLIEKNMPFINNIFLLVSNIEQVPQGISDKVKVVLHKDFIPQKYLPTFNSTTIEMFLHNIEGLSEYFIYANDDMLPIRPMEEEDFFHNGKIKMSFKKESLAECETTFRHQCMNSYNLCRKIFGLNPSLDIYFKPFHTMTPMIKQHNELIIKNYGEKIFPNIRAYRTDEQYNQYIYPLYEFIGGTSLQSQLEFLYTELQDINDIENLGHYDIVCINIVPNDKVAKALIRKLEELCK